MIGEEPTTGESLLLRCVHRRLKINEPKFGKALG